MMLLATNDLSVVYLYMPTQERKKESKNFNFNLPFLSRTFNSPSIWYCIVNNRKNKPEDGYIVVATATLHLTCRSCWWWHQPATSAFTVHNFYRLSVRQCPRRRHTIIWPCLAGWLGRWHYYQWPYVCTRSFIISTTTQSQCHISPTWCPCTRHRSPTPTSTGYTR